MYFYFKTLKSYNTVSLQQPFNTKIYYLIFINFTLKKYQNLALKNIILKNPMSTFFKVNFKDLKVQVLLSL